MYEKDDEVVMEDISKLLEEFITRTIYKFFDDPPPVVPASTQREKALKTVKETCFVITKNKSCSWAEDLAAMTSIKEINRIYS